MLTRDICVKGMAEPSTYLCKITNLGQPMISILTVSDLVLLS